MERYLRELAARGYVSRADVPDSTGSELDDRKQEFAGRWIWTPDNPAGVWPVTTEMLAISIVDGINTYNRELHARGYLDLNSVPDFAGSELNTLKWELAAAVARRWYETT